MCNLYSETKGQAAIRGLFRVQQDRTGNLPSFPAIFPDQTAPIVRNAEGGNRELVLARWGMPGPVQYGGIPVTNIRNVSSPHWRGWLSPKNRCIVPATAFCEYADGKPRCNLLVDMRVKLRNVIVFTLARFTEVARDRRGDITITTGDWYA
jgi:putative SOS response-associated peptidase YedK